MSNEQNRTRPPRRGPMGPGHGPGAGEKAKDFKSAIKRLFSELKGLKTLILIALILAALSSVLSIFAPNRLSNLTDEIQKGIMTPVMDMDAIKGITLLLVGIYACSAEDSSFKALFTDMEVTECKWLPHDGQAPDEEE